MKLQMAKALWKVYAIKKYCTVRLLLFDMWHIIDQPTRIFAYLCVSN